MNCHHQENRNFPPSSATIEYHRQPSSSSSSPMTPTTTNSGDTSTSPESLMAAVLGRAISNMPSTSFQDAIAATTNPLIRTLSGTGSSNYQEFTTMPPKIPQNNPLVRMLSDANSCANQDPSTTSAMETKVPTHCPLQRMALSDIVTMDYNQHGITVTNKPLRRTFSDTVNYQEPPQKKRTPPPRVSSSRIVTPESSVGKRSPQLEKMKKIEDMVKEIEQRCLDIISQDDQAVEDENPIPQPQGQDECVGVERLENGDIRFDLGCSCGKHFEMLLKNNGHCFHRLTYSDCTLRKYRVD